MITDLKEALEHAAKVYGPPMVATIRPVSHDFAAVVFGGIENDGHHATEFLISSNGRTVYYRRQGMDVKLFDCGDFVHRHQSVADRMAEYANQFTVRKSKPCRALTVVTHCRALVVSGHWERLSAVDMINQAEDALYTMLIQARASTYAMGMPI